jgi:hypothetical protein
MTASDDHARLYRLLNMLPSADMTSFWEAVAEASNTSRTYVFEKMSQGVDFASAPEPEHRFASFCFYLVNFFGGNKPNLWDNLPGGLAHSDHSPMGQRLAKDIADTAWRLYVVHQTPAQHDVLKSIRANYFKSFRSAE